MLRFVYRALIHISFWFFHAGVLQCERFNRCISILLTQEFVRIEAFSQAVGNMANYTGTKAWHANTKTKTSEIKHIEANRKMLSLPDVQSENIHKLFNT